MKNAWVIVNYKHYEDDGFIATEPIEERLVNLNECKEISKIMHDKSHRSFDNDNEYMILLEPFKPMKHMLVLRFGSDESARDEMYDRIKNSLQIIA